ncbi:hypothetical protein AMD01_16065 [Priestia koreensis]|uniref:Beta sliding clamp n=2 Tax=Priestia koreensis TaxID=284581 RepID=A0A0M0KXI3_9BACI|nr:hypothetical protein AMD01_16065 [Priestia koreensis]
MDFTIKQATFKRVISEASKAVSAKVGTAVSSGIKITAQPDGLVVTGANLDMVIQLFVPVIEESVEKVHIRETGEAVIPAKLLTELVRKLPHDIHITTSKTKITIRSGEVVTTLQGLDPSHYPALPSFEKHDPIVISSQQFVQMIRQTVFAVAKNSTRPLLTGVHLSVQEGMLRCVATNSHRLALKEQHVTYDQNISLVVPSASLQELVKLIPQEERDLHLFFTTSHAIFQVGSLTVYSRLIEGRYPDVSGLFPTDMKTTLVVHTKSFLQGIDRASLFASEWKHNNIRLELEDGRLNIASFESEMGHVQEKQEVEKIEGEKEFRISLDGSFLLDALKVMEEEHIQIHYDGAMKPIVIEPLSSFSHRHLISPVRS